MTELPLSIFIKEIRKDIILVENNIKNYDITNLFNYDNDENIVIMNFGVTDLISSFTPDDILKLRNNKLILENTQQVEQIYEEEIKFSEKIIKGSFEADFGEYCDKYITRGIINKQNEKFIDNNVKMFLETIELEENEIKYYELYKNTEKIMRKYKNNNITDIPNHIMHYYNIIKTNKNTDNKINKPNETDKSTELNKLNEPNEYLTLITNFINNNQCIYGVDMNNNLNIINDKIISQNKEVRRKYTYPTEIINNIKSSYEKAKQQNLNNNQIINDIYWISLCGNFNCDRNRLAYRNIFQLFDEKLKENNNQLLNRMNDYIKNIKSETRCKIYVTHSFYNKNNDQCKIMGEIDIICGDTLIDIKCSQNDFKLEWMLQLLIYYSLLKPEDRILIKKIAIMNIFNGKYYILEMNNNYKHCDMITFMEKKIMDEQNNIRNNKIPIVYDVLENNNNTNNTNNNNLIIINFDKTKEKKYKIVLDTETTDFVGDIIQLAYIIVDENNNIIEKVNDFIKNRIPTNKSIEIHGITTEKLQKDGIEFNVSIAKFILHLSTCKDFIGHNISFDIKTIMRNIRKYNINILYNNEIVFNIFENINIICTCNLSNRTKLETLYEQLMGNKFNGAHDALNDVLATFECYKKLTYK